MKTLTEKLNESFNINEAFNAAKTVDQLMKLIDDEGWFYESTKSEIKDAKDALKNALKKEEDLNAEYLTDEVLYDFSFDGDKESVFDLFTSVIKKLK